MPEDVLLVAIECLEAEEEGAEVEVEAEEAPVSDGAVDVASLLLADLEEELEEGAASEVMALLVP